MHKHAQHFTAIALPPLVPAVQEDRVRHRRSLWNRINKNNGGEPTPSLSMHPSEVLDALYVSLTSKSPSPFVGQAGHIRVEVAVDRALRRPDALHVHIQVGFVLELVL